MNDTVETKWWHAAGGGRVQCDLCPRGCRMAEGQRGFCYVRMNRGGRVVLATYGRSSGFCVDPIEKKPLNHFFPGTSVLSFGTAGCNLGCRFCQNWDISKSREFQTLTDQASPGEIAWTARELGCHSVAFTYNDPLVFFEYAVDVADACREAGLRTVAVTAGYVNPDPRAEFFRHMDAANVDFKAFSDGFYRRLCGGARLGAVKDTLVHLRHKTDVWFEMTTLLIPGENDSTGEIEAMAAWVVDRLGVDVPWHFSAFHPSWKMSGYSPTPLVTLRRARRIAKEAGVRHVYLGNVHDMVSDTTYCSGCGAPLIRRDWYEILDWNLAPGGKCPQCGEILPGVFDDEPGGWGRRRMTVSCDGGGKTDVPDG